jgi:hypothetical protein
MKYLTLIITLIFSICLISVATGQTAKSTITKTARFSDINDKKNRFIIKNLHGDVLVKAYDGKTVELTINEVIEGTSSEIKQAQNELEYVLERDGNLIVAYLTAPFIKVRSSQDHFGYNVNMKDRNYQFTHDITVRVPQNVLLEASTVNRGILSVTGNFSVINADNVNGDIILKNIVSATNVSTVNGDIEIIFAKPPATDSKYHTVNGRMDFYLPENLSADVYFSSLHGDLYTDFDKITRLSPEVQKENSNNGRTVSYIIDKSTPTRIGNGGPKLNFEVLNGDVYLRKL